MEINPLECAVATIVPFFLAGIAQTAFLKSAFSDKLTWPLDGRRTLFGKRIFGDNKTLRGFVVMVPVTTLCFFGVGLWLSLAGRGWGSGLWQLSLAQWTTLGLAASLGYTLGELPNSFIKRQLGIMPGCAATNPRLRTLFIVVDQFDSVVSALIVISVLVPTGIAYWLECLLIGGLLHWGFNGVLFWLGVKERAA